MWRTVLGWEAQGQTELVERELLVQAERGRTGRVVLGQMAQVVHRVAKETARQRVAEERGRTSESG